ncbi:MAG: hypothetical protein HY774_24480 [Acidobacteria bacterium]|nr:hypothetical protein [Acidobacteriota bacterium]
MKRLQLTSLMYLIGMIWLVFVGGASIWLLTRPHSQMTSLTGAQLSQNPPVSPVNDGIEPPLAEKNPADNRFPQLVQEVTRRLSTDSQPYIFSDEQLEVLREQSFQLSQALNPYLKELNQSQVSQVVLAARREGLEPGLVVYIALAEWIENPSQDFVPIGNKVIATIGPLANRYGVELVDKSLLLIAAYQIAQTGSSPHTMFRERLTGSLANETGRTIWALHRAGKISNGTLAFAFRALAIGCVVQNPAFWGISEIPLVIA